MSNKRFILSAPSTCHQSLGMEDGYIEDFQITSSSAMLKHPASAVRSGELGWAPTENDTSAFIQVSFLALSIGRDYLIGDNTASIRPSVRPYVRPSISTYVPTSASTSIRQYVHTPVNCFTLSRLL